MTSRFIQITWSTALQDNSIKTIQDPVSFACVDKQAYHESYQDFLETLDGRDMISFVDFFFQKSPVNSTQLEFVDEDARLDFFDFLRDYDLIPEFDNLATGDWCRKKKHDTLKIKDTFNSKNMFLS